MLDTALSIPFWLELAATLIGGFSGAMAGVRARYDILGICVIAVITGLSGGIIRDILLQNYGIYALQNPSLIIGCCIVSLVVFFFGRLADSLSTYLDFAFDLLDNFALALWGIIGTAKALSAGLLPVPAIILGTITAAGGGVVRDICMNYEPDAFKAGNFYVTAAVLGCSVFCLMKTSVVLSEYAGTVSVALILAVRYAAIIFDLRTTPPIDLTDALARVGARTARTISRPMVSFIGRVKAPKGKVRRDKDSIVTNYATYVAKTHEARKLADESEGGKPVQDSDHIKLSPDERRKLKENLKPRSKNN